jgi:hypothetical protein
MPAARDSTADRLALKPDADPMGASCRLGGLLANASDPKDDQQSRDEGSTSNLRDALSPGHAEHKPCNGDG